MHKKTMCILNFDQLPENNMILRFVMDAIYTIDDESVTFGQNNASKQGRELNK